MHSVYRPVLLNYYNIIKNKWVTSPRSLSQRRDDSRLRTARVATSHGQRVGEDGGQITGMRTARYRAVPSKIGRRRSIEREIDCRRSIEEEKGGKKRKRKKKKRGIKNTSPVRCPRSLAAADRFFSRVRRRSVSPREETDRGNVAPLFFF
ncbi:hypothetical protein B296_00044662 [Ensete ventricosum]|uniref:Uncharacterized protein n=1 Tax=Ensete ventricosum TaxID=4639 RepID=A0A426Y8Z1_ENSVE|nr:hypothetical protein B296_00044662 [Ensete ventricosum]